MKDIFWTAGAMAIFVWCAIMISIVHTGGHPFEIFQPPLWAMPLAIISWIAVSWLSGKILQHVFDTKSHKS